MPSQKKSGIENIIIKIVHNLDRNSFSAKDKILFFKEIVYMLRGGISIVDAMDTLKKNTSNYALKNITTSVMHYLNQGKSLSYALTRFPEYFNESDVTIIKTGETTGTLDVVLEELASEYTYLNEIKNQYRGALTYPIILIIASFVAIIYLFSSVLPGILDMFSGAIDTLPAVTRFLKHISDFFVNYRKSMLIVLGTGILILGIYNSTQYGKKHLSKFFIEMPIIGGMTKNYFLIKWARYIKLMIGAGLDYVQTFRLLRGVLAIPIYQEMIEKIMAGLQVGKSIYDSIKDETTLIYPNVAMMIKVGEETANLEAAMQNIIEMYQEELNYRIKQFSKIIEPIILIFVGMVIFMVALGIFGVIFSVMESVGI